jgi:hypothetical protein
MTYEKKCQPGSETNPRRIRAYEGWNTHYIIFVSNLFDKGTSSEWNCIEGSLFNTRHELVCWILVLSSKILLKIRTGAI